MTDTSTGQVKILIGGNEIILHYYKQGQGKEVLITFHGFGQTAEAMFPLTHGTGMTCYHIDIFYHGKSFWPERLGRLTPEKWHQVMEKFLAHHGIDRFSVAGFSMGGKFAMATATVFGAQVDQLLLLAPDGIQTSRWYNLANYPLMIRPYFRSMIVKPWRFYRLVNAAERAGLLDRGLSKFASMHMDTRKKRRRVYYSWIMFKPLAIPLRKVARSVRENRIRLMIITGRYDKIITTEGMQRLLRLVPDGEIVELESGHNQLIEKAAVFLEQKNF